MLHTRGLGAPCVCVLTGLSHTAQRLAGIDGISRLGGERDLQHGRDGPGGVRRVGLEDAGSAPRGRRRIGAGRGGPGWSQSFPMVGHSICTSPGPRCVANCCARKAQCGTWTPRGVRAESDRRRHEYYAKTFSSSALGLRPSLTAQIVAKVTAEPPGDRLALTKLCRRELERQGLDDDPDFEPTPTEFAAALLERGGAVADARRPLRCGDPVDGAVARQRTVMPASEGLDRPVCPTSTRVVDRNLFVGRDKRPGDPRAEVIRCGTTCGRERFIQ